MSGLLTTRWPDILMITKTYRYSTAQAQRRTRSCKSICPWQSCQSKGHGTYFTRKFSSCKKQGEYLWVKWVPHPFNWRLLFREQIDSHERVWHCAWVVLYIKHIHVHVRHTTLHYHTYRYTCMSVKRNEPQKRTVINCTYYSTKTPVRLKWHVYCNTEKINSSI